MSKRSFFSAQLPWCLSSRAGGVSPVERVALTYLVHSSAAAGVHLMLQQLRRTRYELITQNEQTEFFQLLSCFTASAAGQRVSVQLRELL